MIDREFHKACFRYRDESIERIRSIVAKIDDDAIPDLQAESTEPGFSYPEEVRALVDLYLECLGLIAACDSIECGLVEGTPEVPNNN